MCDPTTLLAAGLSTAGAASAAGTNAQYVDAVNNANKEAFEISRNARNQEIERQDGYQSQADATFENILGETSRAAHDQEQANATAEFLTEFESRPDVVNTPAVMDSASDAVKSVAALKTNRAAAESRDRIKALAELTAFGGAAGERGRGFAETADTLSTLGGLRRGSLAVANQEQAIPAAEVTPGDTTFADVLSGAGMFLGMAGPGFFSPADAVKPLSATTSANFLPSLY